MASSSHDLVALLQAPSVAEHRPHSQYSNFTTLVGPDSFDAIAHDAELFSMSGIESSVSGTVQGLGLGSTTGHGLMLVGQWAVRGIDALSIEVRLQRVQSVLALGRVVRWTVAHARDLLEYQRSALCSRVTPRLDASLQDPRLFGPRPCQGMGKYLCHARAGRLAPA